MVVWVELFKVSKTVSSICMHILVSPQVVPENDGHKVYQSPMTVNSVNSPQAVRKKSMSRKRLNDSSDGLRGERGRDPGEYRFLINTFSLALSGAGEVNICQGNVEPSGECS